jgi:hypothetical protein
VKTKKLNLNLSLAIPAAVAAMLVLFVGGIALTHAPSGAIFTTLVDGTRVNANIYASKLDVYLDGGPGPNAPQTAAGLDDGIYVFQVTDPSGQVLLSEDAAECRVVEVSDGVITARLDWDGSGIDASDFSAHTNGNDPCHKKNRHEQGDDVDYGPPAITVQLMPYADTPNPGGVYKAWMTRVDDYVLGCQLQGYADDSGLAQIDCGYAPGNFHGFIPAHSKTDNYKVRDRGGPPNAKIIVHKYCDVNCDGTRDAATGQLEPCVNGVTITVTDAAGVVVCSGVTDGGFFVCDGLDTGDYTVTETLGGDYAVCGASLDGVSLGAVTTVAVNLPSHRSEAVVAFGNAPTNGSVNANKTCGTTGAPIDGIQFDLSGTDVLGNQVSATAYTTGGTASFDGLAAGTYTLDETVPPGFAAIGPTSCTVSLSVDTSLDDITGQPNCDVTSADCDFVNVAIGDVGARTPGFWCTQVLRDAGLNPGTGAACFGRLSCEFGSVQAVVDGAFAIFGGDPSLYDLDGDGFIANAEAQNILCPQVGDAEHEQCRRQSFALLMNLWGYLDENSANNCGTGCTNVGTTEDQLVVIDGQLGTVGDIIDLLETDGCTNEVWNLVQGVNENTITVLPDCPASVTP